MLRGAKTDLKKSDSWLKEGSKERLEEAFEALCDCQYKYKYKSLDKCVECALCISTRLEIRGRKMTEPPDQE